MNFLSPAEISEGEKNDCVYYPLFFFKRQRAGSITTPHMVQTVRKQKIHQTYMNIQLLLKQGTNLKNQNKAPLPHPPPP